MPTEAENGRILELIEAEYPDARCSLDFDNPFQLLVATVLSAQCTDERVNKTTPELFRAYPDPERMAGAETETLEGLVRSTGFFRNKAKNLKGAARMITEDFEGRVPRTLKELIRLPGVARKTANVVLGNAYDTPGVVVDTHVKRLSTRIGWTRNTNPDKIERDLMAIWPEERWTRLSHQLIAHGRRICQARKPKCGECMIRSLCDFGKEDMVA